MITKMSDTSEETNQNEQRQGDSNNINSNSSNNNKEECNNGSVCRDFARGICDRKFCKFKHEPDTKMLNFCHDFQNHICPRPNCKFIHCSPEDELEYKATGVMSSHILVEATRKNQLPGTKAICNQFRKGLCRRTSCKYRHLTKEEEDAEIIELIQNNASNRKNVVCVNGPMTESPLGTLSPLNGLHMRNNITVEDYEECGIPLPKRRLIQSQEPEFIGNGDLHSVENIVRPVFKGYYAGTPPPPMLNRIDARTLMLEEENTLLHKEIAQLKRQVSDLTATNEFLLDQNANLRVSQKQRRNEEAAAAAAVQQQQQQQQQHNVAMQPAVTITNTSNAPQVIRTVTASVATVPVSLATVSTCNPVSVSIAGVPATVSMAQPAQILAPSQQILVTTNPSTQLAIANSSQAQQLAIAQQNLANNLAAAQQAAQQHQQQAPQLTSSQAQQLALAATTTQQLALASTPQPQQLTLTNAGQQQQQQHQQLNQQLANHQQAQQVAAAAQQLANQQLTSQAQQLAANMAAANTQQQLTSQQAQQLALVSSTSQQLAASQQAAAQQLANIAAAATTQQQLTLSGTNQQLLVTAQQNLNAAVNQQQQQQQQQQQHQQMEMHRNNQLNAIATSQAIAMSNATQPMVSYPIMTQSINHALTH